MSTVGRKLSVWGTTRLEKLTPIFKPCKACPLGVAASALLCTCSRVPFEVLTRDIHLKKLAPWMYPCVWVTWKASHSECKCVEELGPKLAQVRGKRRPRQTSFVNAAVSMPSPERFFLVFKGVKPETFVVLPVSYKKKLQVQEILNFAQDFRKLRTMSLCSQAFLTRMLSKAAWEQPCYRDAEKKHGRSWRNAKETEGTISNFFLLSRVSMAHGEKVCRR